MNILNIVLSLFNILVTSISVVSAYRAVRYFRKSKHITIYANTNKSLNETEEMLRLLPEALHAVSITKKGYSPENAIREIGIEFVNHYNSVTAAIPTYFSNDFQSIQKTDGFDMSKYINSYIDGSAVVEKKGCKMLDRDSFDTCQERLRELQEYLKKRIVEEEEKLK